jgi:hypothetical protein
VVCGLGTDFTDSHDLVSSDANWVYEPVDIPELEQCYVQAYVSGVEFPVWNDAFEETG